MSDFITPQGVALAYDDIRPAGAESTIVLIHGFASNRREGWRRTGWFAAFERRRIRCAALDQRGHGESQKFYDPAAYAPDALAADVVALLDHLEIERADLFGYSMGSRTAIATAAAAPDRVSSLILGGVGGRLFEPRHPSPGPGEMTVGEAMLAEDVDAIRPELMKSFRHFADEQGGDRRALAAFVQTETPSFRRETLAGLSMPVLVLAGARDEVAGDPAGLAAAFPDGRGVALPGLDHFSAIPHAATKATVFDFLDGSLDWEMR
ncbi:alpha/beta hydrolase [Phenylobacterium sp.]|jgi:pimeloyl-ACP methyl ester carboxylesterase|uniref:alpha/beta fold hydrolase n=1 Tax=Phenylobacterium sp. TaxID=1871053 RepID=UPI002F3FB851